MGQVTIYLDDDTEAKMVASAEAMQISKSKWIATVIQEKLHDQWPLEIREMAGSWETFPDLTDIRDQPSQDSQRESL